MLGSQPSLLTAKQLYHLELSGGACELGLPDARLHSYIDYYWLLTIEQPELHLEVIPDTAVDLVVSPELSEFAVLYFPVAEKFTLKLQGPIRYAGTCLRSATAAQLLHNSLSSLSQLNAGKDTVDALLLEPLVSGIQQKNSMSDVSDVFDQYWLGQLELEPPLCSEPARLSHDELIGVLEHSLGSSSIASVCSALGISERQFRRLSNDLFGLSPKKLQNIMRLQTALDELFHCDSEQLQDLYYDESHRIRELKRLTGCTPKQIRQMAEKYNNR